MGAATGSIICADQAVSSKFSALLAAEPGLQRVATAGELLKLPPKVLLHAGPPLQDPCRPPPVLLSSAVMTCLHEGWARNADEAEALVREGVLTLLPAQSKACVVPLAHLVSAGTPLFEVSDGHAAAMFAPVSTVRGPDTRMGNRDPSLLPRLVQRDQVIAPAWQAALSAHGPVPLLPMAARGLAEGDDLHSRTSGANAALVAWLRQVGAIPLAEDVDATPLSFLTAWMAASAFMLRAAEGGDAPSLVTRAGGNGESFGICLAGEPKIWRSTLAVAPQGHHSVAGTGDLAVCPAIGDSAVIDMLGCGGQTLSSAPEPLLAFAGHLPLQHADLAGKLLCAYHPGLARPVALDAGRVAQHGTTPLMTLAMLAADGVGGFIGRGLYSPPVSLFQV
jgi:hypothetical protein